jgi:hypothetical protein
MSPYEELLELLEAREDPLLSWGIVDGGLTEDELISVVESWAMKSAVFDDVWDLIESLQERGLVFRDNSVDPPLWRTRNAESLRLLSRLRQVFPSRGDDGEAWRRGAPLVADFRYLRRPRAYPRRDQSWQSAVEDMVFVDDVQRQAIELMTTTDSGTLSLSGFQARATRHILSSLNSASSSGTVVGAGTGSGKTLSFYLPAFAYLAGLRDKSTWTRALAVYPRNELLKDQFSTAFGNARMLDNLFRATSGRPISLGVFNGDTPHSNRTLESPYSAWRKEAAGYLCPFLACPGGSGGGCGGGLHWPESDAKKGNECLLCARCGRRYGEAMVVLTRDRMRTSPPDIVFTTTEMLNRSLADLTMCSVIGVGVTKKPRLMLLDEIHTYQGTSGAQAAMVLRRWHRRLRSPVTFVGLSATLVNAAGYFGDLTGVDMDTVTSIEPDQSELEYEGAEYLVALRSDPTTGASVLSTTIQSAMLIPRILDNPQKRVSDGLFGTKAFVFTDDLDVTNRLYYDLLDAEGQRLDRKGPTPYKAPLAALRNPASGGGSARRISGQSWDLPKQLGHVIDDSGRLRISRTSSQDAGVDVDSQLLVATASLEVGFDDPDVGAVLQHKAPRGVAQFLQRKGRAGRPRGMRPLTAVILSDYGRDRGAYEAWDTLFDPLLPEIALPVKNRAVIRMHGTQAMLDWVAEKVRPTAPRANLWRDLTGPANEDKWGAERKQVQKHVADLLERLLDNVDLQIDLARWIQRALQLSPAETNQLLWHPPRPILIGAVPALLRRLRSTWAVARPDGQVSGRDWVGSNPLPDYFPSNLFSDLTLPEGYVRVPPQFASQTESESHAIGVGQMLREFAPGRVSRRFATRNTRHRHWVPLDLDPQSGPIDIDAHLPSYDIEVVATVPYDGRNREVPLIRPHVLDVQITPDDVKDSSNAFLSWHTQLVERGPGKAVRVPQGDPMGSLIRSASFFLHAQNSHVEMRRLALDTDVSIQMANGNEVRRRTTFMRDSSMVGLGATFDVDALRLEIELPVFGEGSLEARRGIRSAWFRHVLTTDAVLLERANRFQLGWLHEGLEIMLVLAAVEGKTTLADAYESVRPDFVAKLEATLEVLFQRPGLDLGGDGNAAAPSRLAQRLRGLLQDPIVSSRVDSLASQFWAPDHEALESWLRLRLLSTIGQAAVVAARGLCPDHDPESLYVDVQPGVRSDGTARTSEVWLSESSIGGGGFLEALASRVRADPRRFLRLAWRAIQPSTVELVNLHMRRILELLGEDGGLTSAVATYRGSASQSERIANLHSLRNEMRASGLLGADHAVISLFANRLLRPGSTQATDKALGQIVARWQAEEERLGVEINARTWAFLMSRSPDHDDGLPIGGDTSVQQRRLDAIQSLLWPTGWRLRSESLQSWNPFASSPDSVPELLREVLPVNKPIIELGSSDAMDRLRAILAESGMVKLKAAAAQAGEVSAVLIDLSTRAIETEFLQLWPRVTQVDQTGNGELVVTLELAEVSA